MLSEIMKKKTFCFGIRTRECEVLGKGVEIIDWVARVTIQRPRSF